MPACSAILFRTDVCKGVVYSDKAVLFPCRQAPSLSPRNGGVVLLLDLLLPSPLRQRHARITFVWAGLPAGRGIGGWLTGWLHCCTGLLHLLHCCRRLSDTVKISQSNKSAISQKSPLPFELKVLEALLAGVWVAVVRRRQRCGGVLGWHCGWRGERGMLVEELGGFERCRGTCWHLQGGCGSVGMVLLLNKHPDGGLVACLLIRSPAPALPAHPPSLVGTSRDGPLLHLQGQAPVNRGRHGADRH